MKHLVTLFSTAAVLMVSSLPAFADQTRADRDECVLASKNCVNQVDDIYKRMHKLDKEIKKGNKVYSPAELKALQAKLDETRQILQRLESAQ